MIEPAEYGIPIPDRFWSHLLAIKMVFFALIFLDFRNSRLLQQVHLIILQDFGESKEQIMGFSKDMKEKYQEFNLTQMVYI